MNVEARLTELIGAPAGRLHTARSRNDQVATDFRLWVRDQCDAAIAGLTALMRALVDQAEAGAEMVMPGFTHLQTAQPVTWGHHMLAYVEMLDRDRGRFRDARARLNESPLGAAALAGTVVSDRPRRHRRGARLRPADGQLASTRSATATSRWSSSPPPASAPPISAASPRRSSSGPRRSSASSRSPTASPPAPRSCRRRRTPTPPSWCAPRSAASSARWWRC